MKNKDQINIFIIDDDKIFTRALKNEIENEFAIHKVRITSFEAGEQCELSLNQQPDIAIVDYHLDSKYKNAMNGVKIIEMIKTCSPHTEIIMFTGEESAEIAVKALRLGAHDYIVKNENLFRRLKMSVLQCVKLWELKNENKKQRSLVFLSMLVSAIIFGAVFGLHYFGPEGF